MNSSKNSGQSLIELLLALSVAVVAIISGFLVLQFLIKRASDEGASQMAAYLREETLKKMHFLSNISYTALIDPSLDSTVDYKFVTAANGTISLTPGIDTQVVSGKPYSVAFRILPVYRDANKNIVSSGNVEDKNTRQVNLAISWTGPDGPVSLFSSTYLTRDRNYSFHQTDWSGGATITADPIFSGSSYNKYKQGTDIDVTTSPGRVTVP